MAVRTTIDKVRAIITTDVSDSDITSYIGGANLFVTNNLGSSTVLDEATLTEIETWMTAHMIAATKERFAKSEEAGSAKVSYIGVFGSGLYSTMYGQMAITLDNTGTLSDLASGKKNMNITAL